MVVPQVPRKRGSNPSPQDNQEQKLIRFSGLRVSLKALEKSIREISEKQNEVEDAQNKAWHLLNKARNMTMQLFVIADDVRATRLEFEKEEGN